MPDYTWEGTSSEARFIGKALEQNAGKVPVMTDDARALSLAVAARGDALANVTCSP